MALADDKAAFLRETLERQGSGACALSREADVVDLSSGVATYRVPSALPIIAAGEKVGENQFRVDIRDGRKPFFVHDPVATAERWNALPDNRRQIVVDLNHDSLYAGAFGGSGEAFGRVVSYEARSDGSIYGNVKWTPEGAELMRLGKYMFTSPVVQFRNETVDGIDRRVLDSVESVALTNNPATYTGLASYSRRDGKDELVDLKQAREALGLPATATEQEVLAAMASGKEALSRVASQGPASDPLAAAREALAAKELDLSRRELAAKQAEIDAKLESLTSKEIEVELGRHRHLTPAQIEKLSAIGKKSGVDAMKESLSLIPVVALDVEIRDGQQQPTAESFTAEDAKFCELANITKESFLASRSQMFGKDVK